MSMLKNNFEVIGLKINCIIPINYLISSYIYFNIPLSFLLVESFTCENFYLFITKIKLF